MPPSCGAYVGQDDFPVLCVRLRGSRAMYRGEWVTRRLGNNQHKYHLLTSLCPQPGAAHANIKEAFRSALGYAAENDELFR